MGVTSLSSRCPKRGRVRTLLVFSIVLTRGRVLISAVEYHYSHTNRLDKEVECRHYVTKIYLNKSLCKGI